jgi:hypothetical protein
MIGQAEWKNNPVNPSGLGAFSVGMARTTDLTSSWEKHLSGPEVSMIGVLGSQTQGRVLYRHNAP